MTSIGVTYAYKKYKNLICVKVIISSCKDFKKLQANQSQHTKMFPRNCGDYTHKNLYRLISIAFLPTSLYVYLFG